MSVPREVLSAYVDRHRQADAGVLPNNQASIKKFQRFHGLTPDGIIDPKTRAAMRRLNTTLGSPKPPGTTPRLIGHHEPNPFGAFGPRTEPS